MKVFCVSAIVLTLAIFGVSATYDGNGQPGCKTEEELKIRIFRNTWDPTAYWLCEALNEPGVLERCPQETGFVDSKKECVSWNEWTWEEPVPPITEPDSE